MRFFGMLLVTILSLTFSLNAYAWNAVGHMLVARIAYDNLKPDVQTKVNSLVAAFNKEYPEKNNFIQLASWPDELRTQKIELYTHWHYVNNGFSFDGTPINEIKDTDNAEWAINLIEPVLSNPDANSFERARCLAFLIHIVGDIHQPLHTVSFFSKETPNGDQGGNLYPIKWKGEPNDLTSLHHIWDNGLGLYANSTFGKKELVNSIMTRFPKSFFGDKVNDLNPADWINESKGLAETFVYKTPENEFPSEEYVKQGQLLEEQRVALAGYRLAGLLNKLLGEGS